MKAKYKCTVTWWVTELDKRKVLVTEWMEYAQYLLFREMMVQVPSSWHYTVEIQG